MNEDEFYTDLKDGSEVPVRRLNEHYILGYDFFPPEEFLVYVHRLLADEGDLDVEYTEEDVLWAKVTSVEFSEPVKIKFANGYDEDAFPVSVLECW